VSGVGAGGACGGARGGARGSARERALALARAHSSPRNPSPSSGRELKDPATPLYEVAGLKTGAILQIYIRPE